MDNLVSRYREAVKNHIMNVKKFKESSIDAKRQSHASEERDYGNKAKQVQSPTMLKHTEPIVSNEDKPIQKIIQILQNMDVGKSIYLNRTQTQKIQGIHKGYTLCSN
jgi:hypothetical protein